MADIKVIGPDNQTFMFPEGTSNEEMASAMQKHYEPTSRTGLAARTVIQGAVNAVAGLPAMMADYATTPGGTLGIAQSLAVPYANRMLGTDFKPLNPDLLKYSKMVGPAGEKLADIAGAPRPKTSGERLAVDVGSAALGALGPAGIGRTLLAAGPRALAPLATRMSATPVLDVASGAAGAAGANFAQSQGATPEGQTLAGAAASTAPYLATVLGRRAVTPFPSTLTPEQQRLAGVLEEAGVPLSAGQATGSRPLQYMENQVSQIPGGDLLARNPTQNQSQQLVQAALRRAGVDAPVATPDVLNAAHASIGNELGTIIQGRTFRTDADFTRDLTNVERNYARRLPTDQRPVVQSYIDDLRAHRFQLRGETYQNARTDLGRAIRAQNGPNGNKDLQRALIGVQEAMDDLANRSLAASGNPDVVDQLAAARQRYANLLTVEDAVARSGEAGMRGEFTPAALEGALKGNVGRRQYVRGFGDLNDLARASSALLRAPPNSGTATRLAPLALGGSIATAYQQGGMPLAAAAAALPTVAGLGINSPLAQAYYRNQLLARPQAYGYGAIPGLLGGP